MRAAVMEPEAADAVEEVVQARPTAAAPPVFCGSRRTHSRGALQAKPKVKAAMKISKKERERSKRFKALKASPSGCSRRPPAALAAAPGASPASHAAGWG